MYKKSLYHVVEDHIKPKVINRLNRLKKWKYGYDKEHDVVVISKTGQIGEIYSIQNLLIALPLAEDVYKCSKKTTEQRWNVLDYPAELKRINTVYDWNQKSVAFKEKHYDYINKEFVKREEGYWYYNKGVATYITGSHYMYLQWTKIDVGHADFRESNRLFYIFWEACKADSRCYGLCYLKNRRSGFSFMASSDTVNQATISRDARFGILSKSGADAKKMFTIRWYPSQSTILSFSSQYKTEWNVPRRSYHTKSRRRDSLAIPLRRQPRISRQVSTPRSTGRTQGTTRTMERNSSSLSTMNRVNGRDQTTSSTTGGLRKQR